MIFLWIMASCLALVLLPCGAAEVMAHCTFDRHHPRRMGAREITLNVNESTLARDRKKLFQMEQAGVAKIKDCPHTVWTIDSAPDKCGQCLHLRAVYVESAPGSCKVVVLIHGFQSDGVTDMSAFVPFYASIGFNVLLIDHRGCGYSEGTYTSLGFYEQRDLQQWCKEIISRMGEGVEILLHGWSMGAVVAMTAAPSLPPQVCGLVFDCGYDTLLHECIYVIYHSLHVPQLLQKFFVQYCNRYCTRKFGFSLQDVSALKAAETIRIPCVFVHGCLDRFVPVALGRDVAQVYGGLYREVLEVPSAGHILSYPVAQQKYEEAIRRMLTVCDMLKMQKTAVLSGPYSNLQK